jgi:hypothetical protein
MEGLKRMTENEPFRLREWVAPKDAGEGGRLFTCGRPGRGIFGTTKRLINDDVVEKWAQGLIAVGIDVIVSLLGKKPDGHSEFQYYSFRSRAESNSKPKFQEWLNHHGSRFVVHEFPTVDLRGIAPDILEAASRCVIHQVSVGRTVVVVDTGGAQRTARICEAVGYKQTPI